MSLAAIGCGNGVDGGGGKDAVLSGTFVGPVTGIQFATPSQSGTTDASGAFAYKAGETVTFTLGGITLGSVLAASSISPFELAGVTPPSTQLELLTKLNDLVIDGFDAAVNVTVFLAALDNDHDGTNGIDVNGWSDKLAGDALRFDINWRRFLSGHFGTIAIANNTQTIQKTSIAAPVAQLYDTLGISFPATYLTRQSYIEGTRPAVLTTYSYDAQHNLVSYASDTDGDGDIDSVTTSTYAPNSALLTTQSEYDRNNDGVTEIYTTTTRTITAAGDITREVNNNDDNAGGFDVATTTQTVDGAHRVLTQHSDYDATGDGSIETTSDLLNTYDTDGNATSAVTTLRAGSDVTETVTTTLTYDARGNQLTLESLDQTTTLIRRRSTSTYDVNGVLLTTSSITDSGPGTPVTLRTDSVATSTADGKTLTRTFTNDSDGDGNPNRRTITTYTYDDGARVMSYAFELDTDGNGTIDRRQSTAYTYRGNISTGTFIDDTNGDGVPESSGVNVQTYDTFGNQLSFHQTLDNDHDGVTDFETTSEYTYDQVPDGVFSTLRDAAF